MPSIHEVKVNNTDRWVIDPTIARSRTGIVYNVVEKRRTKVVLKAENKPADRGLLCDPQYLLPAPAPDAVPAAATVVGVPFKLEDLLHRGTVVRIKPEYLARYKNEDGLFVVAADSRGGGGWAYRLEYLGGHPRGRYLRGMPGSVLDVVPVESINR